MQEKSLSRSASLGCQLLYQAACLMQENGNEMKAADLMALIPERVQLDDWALEVIESNQLSRWRTYLHFFSVDAVKAGYFIKSKGVWRLTPAGEAARLTGEYQFFASAQAAYRLWKKQQLSLLGSADAGVEAQTAALADDLPLQEQFEQLRRSMMLSLSAEMLERIKSQSWQFFERLVIRLLLAMGYGGVGGSGVAFTQAGDGGVDGFINQDKLGLDVVYVQAKRWTDQAVTRPDIQQFVGALAGRQSTRGIFITTTRFTAEAKEFVKHLQVRVILIDGEQLAALMIEHGVGVSVEKTYQLKQVDSDFFNDE